MKKYSVIGKPPTQYIIFESSQSSGWIRKNTNQIPKRIHSHSLVQSSTFTSPCITMMVKLNLNWYLLLSSSSFLYFLGTSTYLQYLVYLLYSSVKIIHCVTSNQSYPVVDTYRNFFFLSSFLFFFFISI